LSESLREQSVAIVLARVGGVEGLLGGRELCSKLCAVPAVRAPGSEQGDGHHNEEADLGDSDPRAHSRI